MEMTCRILAAAILVAREEKWRQRAVWERVQQFSKATGLHFTSPIAPIILGSADDTLKASRFSITPSTHFHDSGNGTTKINLVVSRTKVV
jgi:7-keto-8-aminopelargonate synthetase-like enzyme